MQLFYSSMRMVTPYDFIQFSKVRITDNFAITRRSYCESVESVAIAKLFHQQISQLVLRRSINVAIASNDVEFKQQRRRRLRKRHLIKSLFAFSISFHSTNVRIFLELNSKGLYSSSGKEKESCRRMFPSSTKRDTL